MPRQRSVRSRSVRSHLARSRSAHHHAARLVALVLLPLVLLTACRATAPDGSAATAAGASDGAASATSGGAAAPVDPATPDPAAPTITVGSTSQSLTVGDTPRTYRVYRPAEVASPAPLVVVLHGGFGSGDQAEKAYHWDQQADAGHFVVVYPDGLNHAWNTDGGCCGTPSRTGVDDVAFVTAVVRAVEQAMPVDPSRVYATGISNGGIMAYTLACRTTLFAAIGPDSATELADCPDPAPTSVIHVHGTADQTIRYAGGVGDGVAHIDGPAVETVNAQWRQVDGCAAPTVTTSGAVTTSIATCPSGRTVELITIDGAGHQWPGATPNRVAERLLGTDPPSQALDATAVIWDFFSRHTLT